MDNGQAPSPNPANRRNSRGSSRSNAHRDRDRLPSRNRGHSATHSEYTREYPQIGIYQCTEQAEQIMAQHGINHTVVAVCVPANKHEPK